MSGSRNPRTRSLKVLAQDPSFGRLGKAVTTRLELPAESLTPGPKGHRVHVVDFNASTDTLYAPLRYPKQGDPFENVDNLDRLVGDPQFHMQNTYAISMSVLQRFESSLGRRVGWAFESGAHLLKIAPHAFAEPNAYYSRRDESLMFGYFKDAENKTVFTCLSFDVVAHETTHALLDALRPQFIRPSSLDQGAFHEGFSDLIALLSVIANVEVVEEVLRAKSGRKNVERIGQSTYERESLKNSVLSKIGEEMGRALDPLRRASLRESLSLTPGPNWKKKLETEEFAHPHRRGEILVAAVMTTLLDIWDDRIGGLGGGENVSLDLNRVAEEGATVAQRLVTIAIRALDATPPVDIDFPDYLSALLTADSELYPDDSRYQYRPTLRKSFAGFGIEPASRGTGEEPGTWNRAEAVLDYDCVHFERMQTDAQEVARFVWENRKALEINGDAFTRVQSVRPITRTARDGTVLRETVAEYFQLIDLQGSQLAGYDIRKPKDIADTEWVQLQGGGTLIFDEFGQLKYHIGTGVLSQKQEARISNLRALGADDVEWRSERHFARMHQRRIMGERTPFTERW